MSHTLLVIPGGLVMLAGVYGGAHDRPAHRREILNRGPREGENCYLKQGDFQG